VIQYELTDFDQGFKELGKSLWAELPSKIQFYDPQNPNYVFIVPKDFYREWYRHKNAAEKTKRMWDKLQVKPSYDFPGGSLVKDQRAWYHSLSGMAAVVAAAGIIFVGGVMVIPATASTAAGVTAAELVSAVEAAAAASAEVYGPVQAIVVSTRIAAQVGAGYTATGATIGITAGATASATGGTLAAVFGTSAVKTTIATAGVLMVIIGGPSTAHAKDLPKAKVSAIRAVAVDDFQPLESVQTAVSGGPPTNFSHTPETSKGKFKPGTLVLFDAEPHIIIGTFSVR
jgi:hypothetical protein